MNLLWILLALSLVGNVLLAIVVIRFSRRLLQFDELFETLAQDVDVNVRFFKKLLSTPLFDNSTEVKTANNNMSIISQRLEEFVLRMEDATNKRLRKTEPAPNPPVVR